MAERVAVCPGTYDPVTLGHLDIIRRAAAIFDRIVVGVVRQPRHKQTTMFSLEERIEFIVDSLGDGLSNVEVEGFSTLVVDFARSRSARSIVKGLRAVSDFEWEFQMNNLNRGLAAEVETMYLMASPQYSFLSSRGVREIASFGGAVDDYVPAPVARRLMELHESGSI
jgi:pantetheine-phosphate adenylyltransferase